MWNIVLPMKNAQSALFSRLQQSAVGNRCEFRGDGDDHLRRGSFLRCVMAGKPVAIVFIFPLGPGLDRLSRILFVRSDEMKSKFRLRHAVMKSHIDDHSALYWRWPLDCDLASVIVVLYRLSFSRPL